MKNVRTVTLLSFALLLSACWGGDQTVQVQNPGTESGAIIETEKVEVVMNNGKAITDPAHGKEKGFWYGAVTGVDATKANGVGFTYFFEDGSYLHTINLNVEKLPKGEYYVAWLTAEGGADPVKVGSMSSVFGDARHSARLDTKADLADNNHVLITKETTKDPSAPGTKVAGGLLKRYDRPE
jgi:hypothetical protein